MRRTRQTLFRPRAIRITASLIALMLLASCGGEDREPIRLQANAVGGGQIYVDDLASQDTVLWFWAPW